MLYDNVLVPYDGSASADAALAEAARFAKEDPGLTLHVVSVVSRFDNDYRSPRTKREDCSMITICYCHFEIRITLYFFFNIFL